MSKKRSSGHIAVNVQNIASCGHSFFYLLTDFDNLYVKMLEMMSTINLYFQNGVLGI